MRKLLTAAIFAATLAAGSAAPITTPPASTQETRGTIGSSDGVAATPTPSPDPSALSNSAQPPETSEESGQQSFIDWLLDELGL